jgi:hypothetical protein
MQNLIIDLRYAVRTLIKSPDRRMRWRFLRNASPESRNLLLARWKDSVNLAVFAFLAGFGVCGIESDVMAISGVQSRGVKSRHRLRATRICLL